MRRLLLIISALLPLAVLASACGDATGLGTPLLQADTAVVLRSPTSDAGGPSGIDSRSLILVSPERPEAAGQWDFALRQSGTTFTLVSAPAALGSSLARALLRPSTDSFDDIDDAPRRRSEYSEQPVTIAVGSTFTFRSRQFATTYGVCFNYGKLAVAALDPAAGTARLKLLVNVNCDDPRLTD